MSNMTAKYCNHCNKIVIPKRKIGIGTVVLVLFTYGLWLLCIIFYQKRCPICDGTNLMDQMPEKLITEKRNVIVRRNNARIVQNSETKQNIEENQNTEVIENTGKTNHIHVGDVIKKNNRYNVSIYHSGLDENVIISSVTEEILNYRIDLQKKKWSNWDDTVRHVKVVYSHAKTARMKSEKDLKEKVFIENILIDALAIENKIDWDLLKKNEEFSDVVINKPESPNLIEYPEKPSLSDPILTVIDNLSNTAREKKIKNHEEELSKAISDWEKQLGSIQERNKELEEKYRRELLEWESEIANLEKEKILQSEYNLKIEKLKNDYLKKDTESIVHYCYMILDNSSYPDSFPRLFMIEYNPENNLLVVEYQLPSIDCIPKIKELKYLSSRDEYKEIINSNSEMNNIFENLLYKITLRTIFELFQADTINALDAISFNGWVNTINKATGHEENKCIISIQVKKDEFSKIDLSRVDPKHCFKNLKGVSSSKLSTLTPIQPILQISRSDKRFVQGYDVTDQIDNSTNLAAMDWQDFEHLIRELFEKEFQTNGGEVKVTQASRDGGVDAIAFDPDPIRGGKIVIQAKRYTNVVSVSAVRDLYGTVLNEGATKGILVTTADYGADAYEFAKGKPITLLNGSNLLHLLEKHGHHAKIDLKEAKKILAVEGK